MKKHIPTIIVTLIGLACSSIYVWHQLRVPHQLEMSVFATPGSPAMFVRTPSDVRILIGGGANSSIIKYITDTLPFFSRRIDYVIASQCDKDSVGGLVDIVGRYDIGQVWLREATSTDDVTCTTLRNIVAHKSVAAHMLHVGDTLKWDSGQLSILEGHMMRVTHDSQSIFILGDTRKSIQKVVAQESTMSLSSSIFIIPKSSSDTYISADLISKIQPRHLIYSAKPTKGTSRAKDDPLYMIPKDRRYNLQNKNTIMVSLGEGVVRVE